MPEPKTCTCGEVASDWGTHDMHVRGCPALREGHGGDRRSRLWRSQAVSMGRALAVLVHTPHIRAYLEKHDPKALELAERALRGEGEKT